ncbi:DUF4424 family protein [Thorsellia kenyensis]|uniref:DUF4424 family protein n=1 Tax=Thorsellia kenyensis TaxID=1549888 RepID=A0ABV6CAM1_9GAMM
MRIKLAYFLKKKFSFIISISFALLLYFPLVGIANDTSFGQKNGTIVFERNDDISMEYERLYISREKIRVDYLFHNETDKDILVDISFPMPPEYFGESDNSTIENYQLFVEGKPVDSEILFTVKTSDSIDITQELLNLGWDKTLLMAFLSENGQQRLDFPPLPVILKETNIDDLRFSLLIQNNFTRQQTFKANSLIHITHEYKPSLTTGILIDDSEIRYLEANEFDKSRIGSEFCIDKGFLKTLEGKKLKNEKHYGWDWDTLEYILTTGNNWKGPIKNFNLVIEKDTPEQLISLCFDGELKKISPTRFEFNQVNFEPKEDLQILFIGLYK